MDSERIRASRWYHALIGVGLVSYGLVHLLLAWIAAKVALGGHGDASSQGAMKQLASQPLGAALLWVMAIGLLSLVLWRVLLAIVGQGTPDPMRRLARRAAMIGRAIVYAALAVLAVRVAAGSGGSSSGHAEQTASSQLMQLPAGRLVVAAVGAGIVAVRISEVTKGFRRTFIQRDLASAPRWVRYLGSIGWIAKGIALGAIGALFVVAAITYDAKKAGGMDQALTAMRNQPFGPFLLLAIAAGFAAFGVYCFFWARHPQY